MFLIRRVYLRYKPKGVDAVISVSTLIAANRPQESLYLIFKFRPHSSKLISDKYFSAEIFVSRKKCTVTVHRIPFVFRPQMLERLTCLLYNDRRRLYGTICVCNQLLSRAWLTLIGNARKSRQCDHSLKPADARRFQYFVERFLAFILVLWRVSHKQIYGLYSFAFCDM